MFVATELWVDALDSFIRGIVRAVRVAIVVVISAVVVIVVIVIVVVAVVVVAVKGAVKKLGGWGCAGLGNVAGGTVAAAEGFH